MLRVQSKQSVVHRAMSTWWAAIMGSPLEQFKPSCNKWSLTGVCHVIYVIMVHSVT